MKKEWMRNSERLILCLFGPINTYFGSDAAPSAQKMWAFEKPMSKSTPMPFWMNNTAPPQKMYCSAITWAFILENIL